MGESSAAMDDSRPIACVEVVSSAWTLRSSKIRRLSYSNALPDTVSNRLDRVSVVRQAIGTLARSLNNYKGTSKSQ